MKYSFMKRILLPVILLLSGWLQAQTDAPLVNIRLANPQYDCDNVTYCLDVEMQSEAPGLELFEFNIRFFYDDNQLEFLDFRNFREGYSKFNPDPAIVVTGNASIGSLWFDFPGVPEYVNGAAALTELTKAAPMGIVSQGTWTKYFEICFRVEQGVNIAAVCPPVIWDLDEFGRQGYLQSNQGVVVTAVDPSPGKESQPTRENVIHHNWEWDHIAGLPYGNPVADQCPALACNQPDTIYYVFESCNPAVICADMSALNGTPVSVENLNCDILRYGSFELDSENACITYFPENPGSQLGTDVICLVLCDDAGTCDTSILIISVPPTLVEISGEITPVSCYGENSGSVAIAVTGGTAPYSYQWSNGSQDAVASNLPAGNVSVTVTDALQCTHAMSFTIDQPLAPLEVNLASLAPVCPDADNGTINLTVSGGTAPYQYSWSNSQTTKDIQNLRSGTYEVTVTDANGCQILTETTLSQPECGDPVFDLALEKSLAPGQSGKVNLGDWVRYLITVKNEGNMPAYNVEVADFIPTGMSSPASGNQGWTLTGDVASYTFPDPIQPGDEASVEIVLVVLYAPSGDRKLNLAEVISVTDQNGRPGTDIDSEPNNGNPNEDDEDGQEIELEPHDPTGYIYCDKTGKILTGGSISVVGPNGIANSQVIILQDGSNGQYEFYTDGTPGDYQIFYNHPDGHVLSTTCLHQEGAFDPTGFENPLTFGSDTADGYLIQKDCESNPYYLRFTLEPGDPFIFNNNLPVRCGFIGAIVCDDTNGNGVQDEGETGFPGVDVLLFDCEQPGAPIASTTTDALGHYAFDGLRAGNYQVRFIIPEGFTAFTNERVGEDGNTECFSLGLGACDTTITVCFYTCPAVDAGLDQVICSGNTVQLQATALGRPGQFSWSPATGLSNPDIANPSAAPEVTTTYTVTYDNGFGCTSSDQVTITVSGDGELTLVNTPPATLAAECSEQLSEEAPVFAGGCNDSTPTVVKDSVITPNTCGYTIVRTWTATDGAGQSLSFQQTVNVTDHTAPLITLTHPRLAGKMDGDTVVIQCSDPVIFGVGDAVASDNCDNNPSIRFLENGFSDDPCRIVMRCGWEAKDDCGNVSTLFLFMIFEDTEAPALAGIPADITLENEEVIPMPPLIQAKDVCDPQATLSFEETTEDKGCGYVIVRRWTATDRCGNERVATQRITVTGSNDAVVSAQTPENCGNADGSATLSPADYQYNWSDGGAGAVRNDLAAGVYTVTATSPSGCDKLLEIIIENTCECDQALVLDVSIKPTSCSEASGTANILVEGDADRFIYTWVPNAGSGAGYARTNLPEGDYVVLIYAPGDEDCVEKVYLTIESTEALTVEMLSNQPASCDQSDGSVVFTPVGYAYSWSDGGTGASRNNLAAGDYVVSVTNGICKTTLEVTVDQLSCITDNGTPARLQKRTTPSYLENTVTIGQLDTMCLDMAELTGKNISIQDVCAGQNNAAAIAFLPGTACFTCLALTPGQQQNCLVACDEFGNCDTTYLTIYVREAALQLQNDTLRTLAGKPVVVEVLANDVATAISSLDITTPPQYGTARVQIDNSILYQPTGEDCDTGTPDVFQYRICKGDDCQTAMVFVWVDCEELTVYTGFSPNGDAINDYLRIDGLQRYPEHSLKVFNRWGQEVYSSENYQNDWGGTFQEKELPDGTYFYLLHIPGKTLRGYVQLHRN